MLFKGSIVKHYIVMIDQLKRLNLSRYWKTRGRKFILYNRPLKKKARRQNTGNRGQYDYNHTLEDESGFWS